VLQATRRTISATGHQEDRQCYRRLGGPTVPQATRRTDSATGHHDQGSASMLLCT